MTPAQTAASAGYNPFVVGHWRVLLAGALLVPILVAAVCWRWSRPWITSDTATGLMAWKAWRNGGEWNQLPQPAASSLADTVGSWVSWWSPGQYVWPGLFLEFGLSLGAALILSGVVAAWIRSVGVFFLVRRLGASEDAAALAALVEASAWHLASSFGMYIGGEVVQAALLPWFLVAISALVGRTAWWVAAVPPLLFAAAFAKHTLFVALLGALLWMWWESNLRARARWPRWIGGAVILGVAVLLARYAVSRWIIGGGPTPGDPGQVPHDWLLALGYPSFAPISAATGFGSLAGRAFAVLGIDFNEGWRRLALPLVLLAPLWIGMYAGLARYLAPAPWRRLFVCFLGIYVAVFAFLYARGASVSVEDRHFRPAGMLLIAAVASVAIDSTLAGNLLRRILFAALLLTGGYGLSAVAARAVTVQRLGHVAPSGITQPNLSPAAAAELVRRDTAESSTAQLIVVCDPSVALEIRHSRVLVTDALARPLPWFEALRWAGRVPRLLLVLPANWSDDPRLPALLRCFSGYSAEEWRSDRVADTLFISARD